MNLKFKIHDIPLASLKIQSNLIPYLAVDVALLNRDRYKDTNKIRKIIWKKLERDCIPLQIKGTMGLKMTKTITETKAILGLTRISPNGLAMQRSLC
jgi:hypothetical protein